MKDWNGRAIAFFVGAAVGAALMFLADQSASSLYQHRRMERVWQGAKD